MYFFIASAVTAPTLLKNFPGLQRCPVLKCFLSHGWCLNIMYALYPFKSWSALLTDIVGGKSTKQWTWSGMTSSSIMRIALRCAALRIAAVQIICTGANINGLFAHFGFQIRWKLFCPTAWFKWCNTSIHSAPRRANAIPISVGDASKIRCAQLLARSASLNFLIEISRTTLSSS